MKAPMGMPLLGLIVGILMANAGVGLLWGGAAIAFATIYYIVLIRATQSPVKSYTLNRYHYGWMGLLFLGIGILSGDLNRPQHPDFYHLDKIAATEGRIAEISQLTSSDRCILEVYTFIDTIGRRHKIRNCKIILNIPSTLKKVDDEIICPVKLSRIEDSPNFFISGYARRLANKGIYLKSDCDDNKIKAIGHHTSLRGIASGMRDWCEARIENTHLASSTKKFLITLLLGDRAYLEDRTRTEFADAGISHTLALSGMHIAIIGGILMFLLFPMNFFGLYRERLIFATLLIFFYTFLTGMSPSAVRASLMASAYTISVLIERKNSAWASLLLATFLILLFSPQSLYDAGLHLSFLCVAALIFFVEPLNPIRHKQHPWLHAISSFLLCSLVATAATWSVSAYHFGKVPIMFLPANIVILPLLPVYLTASLIYIFLSSIGLEIPIYGSILDGAHSLAMTFVDALTSGGNSSIEFMPSAVSVVAWLAFGAVCAYTLHWERNRIWKIGSVAMGITAIAVTSITGNAMRNPEFIVQGLQGEYSILGKSCGKEWTIKFNPHTISQTQIGGKRIVFADCDISKRPNENLAGSDIIILGGGYKSSLKDIARLNRKVVIVVHPAMRKAREKTLLTEADSLGISIHSIRQRGAYRHYSSSDATEMIGCPK